MKDKNQPKHFIVLKIFGFIALAVAIGGIVLSIIGFGDFESNNFMIGGFMTCFGLFAGISCLLIGFRPEISKMSVKTARYIQEENKEDLSAMASTSAEISSDAITTVAKSVKNGVKDIVYCKHCGAEIDADSKFCKKCGKEQ